MKLAMRACQSYQIDEIELLNNLKQRIDSALKSAQVYVERSYIRNTKGWPRNFEDINSEYNCKTSVTGTACALIALMVCRRDQGEQSVVNGSKFIQDSIRDGAGWGDLANDKKSLTRATCLAIDALVRATRPDIPDAVHAGLDWLTTIQNDDSGWGYAEDVGSDTPSTSYAVLTLSRALNGAYLSEDPEEMGKWRDVRDAGREWLLSKKEGDHWNRNKKGALPELDATELRLALTHTSHAVEALIECGNNPVDLADTREWILRNIPNPSSDDDSEIVREESGEYQWTHLIQERGLIALLLLNEEIDNAKVIQSAESILNRQHPDIGYWLVKGQAQNGPSWAISEAVRSLALLKARFDRDLDQYSTTALYQSVQLLHERVTKLERPSALDKTFDGVTRAAKFLALHWRILLFISSLGVAIAGVILAIQQSQAAMTLAAIIGILGLPTLVLSVTQGIRTKFSPQESKKK